VQSKPDQFEMKSLPAAEDIRAALGRMFAVDPFQHSPQLAAFLKFIVEETLGGKGNDLKGYTIATLALGRPVDFDPQTDPIVRVQAGRVRQAIQEYYQAHPADPIRILFEKGSYQPKFIFRPLSINHVVHPDKAFAPSVMMDGVLAIPRPLEIAQEPLSLTKATVESVLPRTIRDKPQYELTLQGIFGFATIAAMLGIVALFMFGVLAPKLAEVPLAPRQSYFPTLIIDGGNGPSDPLELLAIVQRTQNALTRFDDIVIVLDSQDERGTSQLAPVRAKAERLVLKISGNYSDRGRVRFSARLVEQLDQRVVWAQEFEPIVSGTAGDVGRSEIVRAIATTIARPYGVVHAYARQAFASVEEKQSDFGCIMVAFDYWQHSEKEMRTSAKKCLENQLTKNPRLGAVHSQLAYLYLDDYRFDDVDHQKQVLDRAIAAAFRGANLSPISARSYQTLLAIHFVRKEMESAWRAADQALKLNPFDSDIMADVAVHYISAGQFAKGLTLLEESMTYINNPPDWIVTYRSIALLMLGRTDEAAMILKPIKSSESPLAMVGTILVSFHEKDQQGATESINAFRKIHPKIFANPKAYLERLNIERGMTNLLLSRYQAALTWSGQSS
jgi:tetratricopeptide (TPR) repeat protein